MLKCGARPLQDEITLPAHLIYLKNVVRQEVAAFPGCTLGMIGIRLRTRVPGATTHIIQEMIEDGELVTSFKSVEGTQRPVRVLYLPDQLDFDDIMVDSSMEVETSNYDLDARY